MGNAAPNKPDRLLGKNRDFTLLWSGQSVAALGSTSCLVAYPLLILDVTHSPAQVGLVLAVGVITRLVVGLPAGVVVDRCDKRWLMLACGFGQVAAQSVLAAAIVGEQVSIALVLVVEVFGATLATFFGIAEETAVRQVVHSDHLSLALARSEARGAAAALAGPPLGGLLFAITPALPFAANAVSSLVSFTCIAFIRTPMPSSPRNRPTANGGWTVGGRDLLDGLRWIWHQPFLRVTLLLISGNNLVSNALTIIVVVVSRERGDSAATTGLLMTFAGTGTLAGALLAPRLVRRLSVRTILVVNRCLWAGLIPLFLLVDDTYVIGALFAVMFAMGPTGSTAVTMHQMAVTPADLQGRASSARGFFTTLAAPLGLGLAGFSLGHFGLTVSVLALTVWVILMAVIATCSRALRSRSVSQKTGRGTR
jgi:MFS family permease